MGLRISNYGCELQWSYGDSNPRPLACHPVATRPQKSLAQVTVPPSTQQSTGIQTRCGTSLLYGPMPPTACSSAESCSGQRREIPCCHASNRSEERRGG